MSDYFFNWYSIPYWISGFILLSVVGLLISKKRRDKAVQLFIVALLSLAIMVLAAAMATCSRKPDVWDVWNSINAVLSILGVVVLYHFSYVVLTGRDPFQDRRIIPIYILPLFFLIFVLINPEHSIVESPDTDLGIYGKEFTGPYWFFKPLQYLVIGLLAFITTVNFVLMFRESRDYLKRKQALYFIFSFLIPLVGFTISVLLVEIFSTPPRVQLGMVALSATGIIIAYGILKHQLFDIEFIVKRTFVYLVITLVLIGVFRLIELVLSYAISSTLFGGDLFARLVAAAVVAGFFFPLRSLGIKIGDRLFPRLAQSVNYDYKKEMAIYKKQLEHALEDGKIDGKEERMLKALREDLGIPEEEHEGLKNEILEKKSGSE